MIDLTALYQTGYQRIGSMQTVLYHRRTATSTFAPAVAVASVFKNAVERDEGVFAGEQLAGASTVFHLWKDNLAGIAPKANDVIEDNENVRWMVTAVRNCDRGTSGVQRFRCECTRERP